MIRLDDNEVVCSLEKGTPSWCVRQLHNLHQYVHKYVCICTYMYMYVHIQVVCSLEKGTPSWCVRKLHNLNVSIVCVYVSVCVCMSEKGVLHLGACVSFVTCISMCVYIHTYICMYTHTCMYV